MTKFLTLGLLSASIAPAYGFWRMECRGVGGYYRIDPLVSPGEPSSHVHSIQGSGGFSETSGYSDIRASNCTSCLVTEDKSSYWHPPLYFQDSSSGEFQLVPQVGGTLAYYLLNTGNGNTSITAFPENFRMIAGDNSRRDFSAGNFEMVDPPKSNWASLNQTTQDRLAQRAIGFNCLNYNKEAESSLYRHFLPDKAYLDANCPDGIRFELMFPSCWNGKDVDSDNHKDHMAYPDLVMSGDCPDGFPIRLPSLFYETIWNTASFKSKTGQFAISNGDVQGFAYHGDFMTGWEVSFLQQAVDTCTNQSGRIEDCSLFTIQSTAEADKCKIAAPSNLANEDTEGPGLASLPGNLSLFGTYIGATMIATYDAALSHQADATLGIDGVAGSGVTATAVASASASAAVSVKVGFTVAAALNSDTSSVTVNNVGAATAEAVPTTTPTSTPASTPASTAVPATSPDAAAVSSSPTTAVTTTLVAASASGNAGARTQYITSNGVVTEIVWVDTTVIETATPETLWTTLTVTSNTPLVKARHAHNHMRRHGERHAHNHAR